MDAQADQAVSPASDVSEYGESSQPQRNRSADSKSGSAGQRVTFDLSNESQGEKGDSSVASRGLGRRKSSQKLLRRSSSRVMSNSGWVGNSKEGEEDDIKEETEPKPMMEEGAAEAPKPSPRMKAFGFRGAAESIKLKIKFQAADSSNTEKMPAGLLQMKEHGHDLKPQATGMRHFGLGKMGISRAVMKFRGPPEEQPLTLCFHFPSTFITHRYVMDMISNRIKTLPGARITGIQFVDRNVLHGSQGLDNRWLITVSNQLTKEVLLKTGLQIYNRKISFRRYDDILADEYKEFMKYEQLQKTLYQKLQDMEGQEKTDYLQAGVIATNKQQPPLPQDVKKVLMEMKRTEVKALTPAGHGEAGAVDQTVEGGDAAASGSRPESTTVQHVDIEERNTPVNVVQRTPAKDLSHETRSRRSASNSAKHDNRTRASTASARSRSHTDHPQSADSTAGRPVVVIPGMNSSSQTPDSERQPGQQPLPMPTRAKSAYTGNRTPSAGSHTSKQSNDDTPRLLNRHKTSNAWK